MSAGRPQRLFFALWPDAAARDALAASAVALRRVCGGRPPPPHNLHLTLAFLGNVPALRLPELEDLAAGLATQEPCSPCPPFMLTLDRIVWQRRSNLVWAGIRDCPGALEMLAVVLADSLQAQGFHTERRRFHPHVTLLRDAVRMPEPAAFEPVSWRAAEFVLARSAHENSSHGYQIVGKWPLRYGAARL